MESLMGRNGMRICKELLLSVGLVTLCLDAARSEDGTRNVIPVGEVSAINTGVVNRNERKMKVFEPKAPYAFKRLNPSSFQAQGRWRDMLTTLANGWIKRMANAEHETTYSMNWALDWKKADADAAVICAYTMGGMVRLGYMVPGSWLASKLHADYLPKVFASQRENGYLGSGYSMGCFNKNSKDSPVPDWEPIAADCNLDSLIRIYEFSGDPAALKAADRFGDFLLREYLVGEKRNPQLQWYQHGPSMFRALYELYQYTGNQKILDTLQAQAKIDEPSFKDGIYRQKLRHTHLPDLNFRLQALLNIYQYTGNKEYFDMAMAGYNELTSWALQASGALTGGEHTSPADPRHYTEHCGVVEWMNTNCRFLETTGKIAYADAAERAIYNAYFGSKSPDGVTLAYFHAPNQIYATTWTGEKTQMGEHSGCFWGYYSMCHRPYCCNAITSKGFPIFIEHAVMASPDHGLAVIFYGPLQTKTAIAGIGAVTILQTTDYPFEDEINLTVSSGSGKPFPLHLRIPGWCQSAEITINGQPVDTVATPGTFAGLTRDWGKSDQIKIRFQIPVTFARAKDPQSWRMTSPGIAIQRGALTYALPITADWRYIGPEKPGPDNCNETYNLVPRENAVWNIALDFDVKNPEKSVGLARLDTTGFQHPWEKSPVGLKVKARILPDWKEEWANGHPQTPAMPTKAQLEHPGDEKTVTLVPFGFTQLRMTYLPILGAYGNNNLNP